ncbi:hypothetical protein [Pontibacter indicus]|uniref:Outer membrane protein beta-barrel domain-containing protein n=1 Tax=Pontibacter indicus TaxID=1317125 RepID=A0A1R3WF80_9BACT|nr:hypothetical protein [Pontibacter indicus]SIT75854.1 hypothetical protein SAMN05444128_0257 [Pontibacter indicus]
MRRRMVFGFRFSLILILFILPAFRCDAQVLSGEVFAGTAWNLPTNLKIKQPGENDIVFKARYRTRPFVGSPYYAYRVGFQQWSLELVHHKLYLQNPPPEIEHFEVSHGYNMVMLSRALSYMQNPSLFRLGFGIVVGHPEGSIRGRKINPVKSLLGGGYHLSGISFQASIGPQLKITDHWFFRPEAKLTAAWARFPLVGGGSARVPNIAFHTLVGVGYQGSYKGAAR